LEQLHLLITIPTHFVVDRRVLLNALLPDC